MNEYIRQRPAHTSGIPDKTVIRNQQRQIDSLQRRIDDLTEQLDNKNKAIAAFKKWQVQVATMRLKQCVMFLSGRVLSYDLEPLRKVCKTNRKADGYTKQLMQKLWNYSEAVEALKKIHKDLESQV